MVRALRVKLTFTLQINKKLSCNYFVAFNKLLLLLKSLVTRIVFFQPIDNHKQNKDLLLTRSHETSAFPMYPLGQVQTGRSAPVRSCPGVHLALAPQGLGSHRSPVTSLISEGLRNEPCGTPYCLTIYVMLSFLSQ